MFKNLAKWTNRRLKSSIWVVSVSVALLSYLAPMATVLAMCWGSSGGGKWKLPITALAIFCFFLFALTHFFRKSIARMSIYDSKSQTLKHVLEAVSALVVPMTIMVLSGLFATWLEEKLDFYNEMVLICLAFWCCGSLVDHLCLGFLLDERSIREKARESNAVESRREIVKGK